MDVQFFEMVTKGYQPSRSGAFSIRFLIMSTCTVIGLLLIMPYAIAFLLHQGAVGKVVEVFVTPVSEGKSRLSIAYEFTISKRHETYLAYGLGDDRFRLCEDPVLPHAQADELAARLRNRLGRVFYSANDPSGTALIITDDNTGLRRHFIGLALVLISLAISLPWRLFGFRRRE